MDREPTTPSGEPAGTGEPAAVSQESVLSLAHRPWPAGGRRRRPPRRLPVTASLGLAGPTLFVLALAVLAWQLPFYRASGGEAGLPAPRHLPFARNGLDLELVPVLHVEAERATLDGRRVDDLAVLRDELLTLRRNWALLHPRDPWPATLGIDAPCDLPWARLRPLLRTAADADYGRLSFLVQVSEPEAPFDWSRFATSAD